MVSTPLVRRSLGVRVTTLPTAPSIAKSLLVSRDSTTIQQVTNALESLAIATEVCVDVGRAKRVLNSTKFEAVTIDFDLDKNAPELIESMRVSPSNGTVPALAITRGESELTSAYGVGANFVLQRPLTKESLTRTLNVGYGLVVRERRRYFRCFVRTRVLMRGVNVRETYTVNVSEGGMEICSAPPKLVPGMRVLAELVLPDSNIGLRAVCEIRWRNVRNHAGLQFLTMPLEQRCDLQEWLSDRLEEGLPESVRAKFHDANEARPRETSYPAKTSRQ
jgi:PilZ domain